MVTNPGLKTRDEGEAEDSLVHSTTDDRPPPPPNLASLGDPVPPTIAARQHSSSENSLKFPETSQELFAHQGNTQKRKDAPEDGPSKKRPRKLSSPALIQSTTSPDLVGNGQTGASKRLHESAEKALDEHCQESRPESQLSEKNLKKLERELAGFDEMDPVATSRDRGRKRAPSRQTSSSDLNQDTATTPSRKSSVSNTFYRYHILERSNIYIRHGAFPSDVQAQMGVIFGRELPEERKREISGIVKDTSQEFVTALQGAHREDDLVELIHNALHRMDKAHDFVFCRKADWDPGLKPTFRKAMWNVRNPIPSTDEAPGPIDRPNERQSRDQLPSSLDASRSAMPPPMFPPQTQHDVVKTPRPDFTIGLSPSTMTNALNQRGLGRYQADDFLQYLQSEQKLCIDPTQNFLNVRFPNLVVEGKAYATGTTVFEAQNQAAVAGSCMINLQQQRADLVEAVFPNTGGGSPHLAFSICTQGPHIELWVHYASSEGGVRRHFMNIVKTCYGSLTSGLEDFLMDVDRLMTWTKTEYLHEIADQLYKLASHAAQE